ncbi:MULTISPECIES: polysaccharide pyruvyl transferase family protein [unclassified Roseobacter]|uniref:polysaccharide pyruvyl transferase family protein n=1 Tax=unclassified Roseobacter TaxID=196798 RepID=UPI0030EE60CF
MPNKPRILHVGIHNSLNHNAGDTLLFPVVRKTFEHFLGPVEWELCQAWEPFTLEDAQRVNEFFDGLVLGGGGLLLRDQAGSDSTRSGWQWNCETAAVNALDIPLFTFAIGYNRFRGQPEFDSIFTENIRALVAKSSFFSLRNNGSIESLKRYLSGSQSSKLCRQFCPTTIIWQLFPEYRRDSLNHYGKNKKVLSVNAAFDRINLRIPHFSDHYLNQFALSLKSACDNGWEILLTLHKKVDQQIEPFLRAEGIRYKIIDLTQSTPNQIMAFYAEVDAVVGMRGHSQMIPFGLRKPIFSIISHDKMKFFLDDIGHPEWGEEITSPELNSKIIGFLSALECARDDMNASISCAQESVFCETVKNFDSIRRVLSL